MSLPTSFAPGNPVSCAAPAPQAARGRVTRRAFVAGAACTAASVAVAQTVLPRAARADEGEPGDEVVIFHTNDVHGHVQGDGESTVGIDYVAGLHACAPNSLLVDAGDATQGMPCVSLAKGATAIELMNAAGYDAMCLGNHEFDFGRDVLIANAEAAAFPMLSANMLREDGAALLDGVGVCGDGAQALLTCAGRRIGLFGLTTTKTSCSTLPGNVEGLTFADEVEAAESCIASLVEQGAEAVVALAHLGNGNVPCRGEDLAAGLSPEAAAHLVAIVDGHSHTVENAEVNGVLVVQTGCNLASVGKLTLSFGADGSVSAAEELLDPAAAAEDAEPLSAVTEELAQVSAEQDALMAEVLFDTPTTLWGGWFLGGNPMRMVRAVETNLGDAVCDAFIAAAAPSLEEAGKAGMPLVAVENGGGIRESFARGAVSVGSLVTTFPFSNTVIVRQVTPSILRAVIENGLVAMDGQDADTGMLTQEAVSGSFMQVAGCTVVCDPDAEAGARVTSITLDGTDVPLDLDDDATPIALVSNSYVMAGGEAFPMLADAEQLVEVGGELAVVQTYFEEQATGEPGADGLPRLPLLARTEGRIQMRGGYEPHDWTAAVRVVDADGAALPQYALTLEVDASERFDVVTDDDGLAHLDLSDGPHAVAAVPADGADQDAALAECYVDNYMGIGLVEDEQRVYPSVQAS